MRQLELLQTITEIALLIALFTVGIKLRVPVGDWRWSLPLRLATISMVLTIAAVTAAGIWLLGLSPGMALLLGAILAPTDPVLASDVQLRSAHDRDTLRFALTGEGGLNDGTAFPFVLLGLGLLGLHDIGELRPALAGRSTWCGARSAASASASWWAWAWRAACGGCAPGGATR